MKSERITVEILKADVPNKNGRVYPLKEIQSMIAQANEREATGQLLGELGVGEGTSINLDRVSHTVSNARMQGDTVVADIRILKTPMGNIIEQLLDGGVSVDYRPRGTATISETGIVTDYNLISIDAVMNGA